MRLKEPEEDGRENKDFHKKNAVKIFDKKFEVKSFYNFFPQYYSSLVKCNQSTLSHANRSFFGFPAEQNRKFFWLSGRVKSKFGASKKKKKSRVKKQLGNNRFIIDP